MMKRLLAACLALAITAPLCGCWDMTEISDLMFVTGIGIDLPEEGSGVSVSAELAAIGADSETQHKSVVFEHSGGNITEALSGLLFAFPGRLYLNHCKVVLLGEEYAKKEGIRDIIDIILKYNSFQASTILAVTSGCRAGEILSAKGEAVPINSYELAQTVRANLPQCMSMTKTDAHRARTQLDSQGSGIVLTRVFLQEGAEKGRVMASGGAAVNGDGLIGFLDEKETQSYRIIKGDAKQGMSFAQVGPEERITATVGHIGSSQKSSFKNSSSPRLDISVQAKAQLIEIGSLDSGGEGIQEAEKSLSEEIEAGILSLVERAQREFKCDIFGFSSTFNRQNRREADNIGENWFKLFRRLELSVDVDMRVDDTGYIVSGGK